MNVTLSFHEYRLSGGDIQSGGDTQILPDVIKFV